jgi:hypothetical protein
MAKHPKRGRRLKVSLRVIDGGKSTGPSVSKSPRPDPSLSYDGAYPLSAKRYFSRPGRRRCYIKLLCQDVTGLAA